MICPNCEKEIANNIAQCQYCGCRFPVKEPPKPPVAPPQQKPQVTKPMVAPVVPIQEIKQQATATRGKLCPHCKQTISETATFCKFCGKQVVVKEQTIETTQANIKICQNCNKEINATATFCKWCGTKCV